MKDRESNKVIAKPLPERTKEEIHGFIVNNVSPEAKVYTYDHESVNHSVGEYVREQAHTKLNRELFGCPEKRILWDL